VLPTLPPTTDGRKTRIPDVQKTEADQLRALLAASNWLQLLNLAEDRFAQAPLWLDRQFFVWSALSGLGPSFRAARDAVADELAQLLRRLPGIENLAFAGGFPFADETTLTWIREMVLAEGAGPAGHGGGASGPAIAAESDGALDEALAEARELARDGRLPEAIRRLQAGPPGGGSGRARFLWRMAQARLAQDAGKGRQVIPLWESLVEAIDRHGLEAWDPELCLAVLRALWTLIRADKDRAAQADEIYRRICRLDPAAALELG
ncbi:MAG: type VI secretion system domain-containing protein, partial [bacterium]|nr:type VI secretion system domain-containing protein [bacterium]